MNGGSVQFSFALGESGHLVNISNTKSGESYQCPGCAEPMVAVKGLHKTHHFRHLNAECRFETYLHQTAKEAFYQTFIKAVEKDTPLTLILERKVICRSPRSMYLEAFSGPCVNRVPANYDLSTLFVGAKLEKNDDTGMRPDILLFDLSSSRKCYVEICVTHPCTEEKIQLGIPIIEFSLSEADDVEYILDGRYHYSDPSITLYNFNVPERDFYACIDNCSLNSEKFGLLSITETGLVRINKKKLSDLSDQQLQSKTCLHEKMADTDISNRIRDCLTESDPASIYPNCVRCIHSKGWNNGTPSCLQKHRNVQYTEARQCQHYRDING